ncbi:MAG: DUF4177 domain-containing protein [Pseudodonghicola sp.]
MPRYEYKVVPAPSKGRKAKGVKSPESRFALAVEDTLNQMGAEGWEYLRADLLPSDERSGLTGSTVNWRNLLVFRRALDSSTEAFRPRLLEATEPVAPAVEAAAAAEPPAPQPAAAQKPPLRATRRDAEPEADEDEDDNGVEATRDTDAIGAALKARARLTATRPGDD